MAIAFLRELRTRAANKFRNEPTEIDGVWFQSKREARRWAELKLLERAGAITGLARQVRFSLFVHTWDHHHPVGHYVADFVYRRLPAPIGGVEPWELVVEDAKGVRTELYRWKKRHFELQTGWKIHEV